MLRRPPTLFAFHFSLFAILFLAPALPAFAQDAAQSMRESFLIESDGTAEKRLATVAEYAEQQEWDAALDLLREVSASRPDGLIRVGPTRSLALSRYCDIMRANLPPAGRDAYRSRVDPQAEALLGEAERTGETRRLERIVDEFFLASTGDEALDRLGEIAWERGEISLARHYWMMLTPPNPRGDRTETDSSAQLRAPLSRSERRRSDDQNDLPPLLRYPDTDLELAGIEARLVMCSIARGEHARARRELEALGKRHPNARGWLAGREGVLAETLEQLLPGDASHEDDETVRTGDDEWLPRPRPWGTKTVGSHPSRSGALAFDPSISLPRWSQPLPASPHAVDPARPALPSPPPLSSYPVVWRDKVFVASAEAVYGFEQATGHPAWSKEAGGSPQIHPPAVGPAVGGAASREEPHAPRSGVPRHSLTVAGDRLYARLGPPITRWPERVDLRREETTLVCLDLADEGRLAWTLSGDALGEANERWSFEGPPVATDEALFVLASRSQPQPSLRMVCLDAATGTVRWQRAVGIPLNLPPAGTAVMSHRLVTCAAGRLYVATDQGAVVCMSAEEGEIEWVGWYRSVPSGESVPENLADRGLPAMALFAGGILVVAPNDSASVFAFEAFSGVRLWRRTIRGGAGQLLGARDMTLIVAGERLHGLDLATGRTRWTVGFENPPGYGAGRGLVGARFAYWPTREDLFVVDWRGGRIEGRIRLEQVLGLSGGGNLAASPRGLFLAGPERLLGFPTFDTQAAINQ